ncbi:MAG: hypothetical protein LAO07_18055 [Acidobacteriia bacterium]|nr:hypothetical protein [Terriglobia bacterium]
MINAKPFLGLLIAVAWGMSPLAADTLLQTDPQGRQVVILRDAIVVEEDSSSILYKHFELKERRVEKVRVSRGALDYHIVYSKPEERAQIIKIWRRFGYAAVVTDLDGKTTTLYDAYLDFYPPGGRGSLLESVPARTTFPITIEGGGADELEFSKIERVEFQQGMMQLTLRTGKTVQAHFLMPTDKPAETRLLGITDRYDPASKEVFDFFVPLNRLKEIRFE